MLRKRISLEEYSGQYDALFSLVKESDRARDWEMQDLYIEALQRLRDQNPKTAAEHPNYLASVALSGLTVGKDLMVSVVSYARPPHEPVPKIPYVPVEASAYLESDLGPVYAGYWASVFSRTIALVEQGNQEYTKRSPDELNLDDILEVKGAQDRTIKALATRLCALAGVEAPQEIKSFRSRMFPAVTLTPEGVSHEL